MPHPPYDPKLLDAIESLTTTDWEGVIWRALIGTGAPLRTNQKGARWNPSGVEALYCSTVESGAVAEIEYLKRRQPVPISKPHTIHRLRAHLSRVADLSSDDAIARVGLTRAALLSDDVSVSQRVGGAVEWLQFGGLLVPSARSLATNLVVFVNNLSLSDLLEEVSID